MSFSPMWRRRVFAAFTVISFGGHSAADDEAKNKPASTHRPVISPDGSQIAFMSDRFGEWELFVMSIDSQSVKRLTEHQGWDGYPAWSPDGTRLVFDRGEDERGSEKYPHILDLDTGAIRMLHKYDTWVSVGVWTENGKMIGFREQERKGRRDLVWIDASTGEITPITKTPDISEGDAALAPDGRTLYFVAARGGSGGVDGRTAIERIDLESGARAHLVDGQQRIYGLALSPDGTQIALTDTPTNEENAEIYLYTIESGEMRRLTHNDAWDHMPVWTPDGRFLIFTSYRSGHEEPYLLDPESRRAFRLSFD